MKMNGARILVEELIHQGVEVIFGYPGGAILNVYDALYEYKDEITHEEDNQLQKALDVI